MFNSQTTGITTGQFSGIDETARGNKTGAGRVVQAKNDWTGQ
jgi:hypothetical protein